MKFKTKPHLWVAVVVFLSACSSPSGRREAVTGGQGTPNGKEIPAAESSLSPSEASGGATAGESPAVTAGKGVPAPAGAARPAATTPSTLRKVTFYLENSESMFGYVSGVTRYVDVVSELAEKPDFVKEEIPREFFFINGSGPVVTPLGDDPVVLKKKLNTTGFRCGDVTRSNLNGMFQMALDQAGEGIISILISDGIYDIGDGGMTSLVTSGKETRSRFIRRLQSGNLQTIMIKLTSEFRGNYFYASRKGKINLDTERPYYIWIFGDSHLLGRYFPDSYLSEELSGYETLARFLKPSGLPVPWQLVSENSVGTFRFDHKGKNKLVDARSDRNGRGFQVSLAVDFSSLPFPGEFYTDPANYECSGSYAVEKVQIPPRKIHAVPFTPTHLLSVKTMKNPAGKITVSLVNRVPRWIATTASADEENITGDSSHTFGLNYLTDAIVEAYRSVSESKPMVTFAFEIQ